MQIDELNDQIIKGITNSLSSGINEAFKFTVMNYTNSNNDFFKKSRGFAEEVLFRLYQWKIFHEGLNEEIDLPTYVLDAVVRKRIHQERLDNLHSKYVEQAQNELEKGSDLYHSGNVEEGVVCYRISARLGNISAMYEYGLFLCDGEGCEKNALEGSYWYWEAAQAGEIRAMYNLGINYREGLGIKRDMTQMLYWYARAALDLCEPAVYSLAESLILEEVLSGENVAQIGRIMRRAAADMEDSQRARDFVKNNTEVILGILKDSGELYNV